MDYGKTLILAKRWVEAQDVFEKLELQGRSEASLSYYLAKCFAKNREFERAKEELRALTASEYIAGGDRLRQRILLLDTATIPAEKDAVVNQIKKAFAEHQSPENTFQYAYSIAISGRPLEAGQLVTAISDSYLKEFPGSDVSMWESIRDYYLAGKIPEDVWIQFPFD